MSTGQSPGARQSPRAVRELALPERQLAAATDTGSDKHGDGSLTQPSVGSPAQHRPDTAALPDRLEQELVHQHRGRNAPLRAADVLAAVRAWPAVLTALGVNPRYLDRKHGPCPICGGKDRYRFTDYRKRGDFICAQCAPKGEDGLTLLQRVFGWSFREALQRVAGITGASPAPCHPVAPAYATDEAPATPSRRVRDLLRTSCDPGDVADVRAYLTSRCLWPLPAGHGLRGHALADDYREGQFPALIALVKDINGELVTAHVTFLQDGRKRPGDAPRKILSPMTGRVGCAVRLGPVATALGVAEGIETALSATVLHNIPVWSCLNAGQLERFTPPAGVTELHVFADRDVAGLTAAGKLLERLQGQIALKLRLPPHDCKDFNDALRQRVAT